MFENVACLSHFIVNNDSKCIHYYFFNKCIYVDGWLVGASHPAPPGGTAYSRHCMLLPEHWKHRGP